MVKLKRIIIFTKRPRKKIRNQNNKDQIGKHDTINLNWMMKLKTDKTFTKGPRKKIKNPKNKDQIAECNIW
jgi:stalled ribosome rescue protein Dom34